jgi:putative membrane protein
MINIKKLLLVALTVSSVSFLTTSCDSPATKEADKSPEKVAEDKNEGKFTTKTSEKDAQFVVDAVAGNLTEIKYAQLAQQKSTDTKIKTVAAELEKAHQSMLGELKTLAAAKAISIPSEEPDEAKKDLNKIADDKNFSKKWCKEMIDKHEKTISRYEEQVKETTDPELKNWITGALPAVRTHLDDLKKCHDSMN